LPPNATRQPSVSRWANGQKEQDNEDEDNNALSNNIDRFSLTWWNLHDSRRIRARVISHTQEHPSASDEIYVGCYVALVGNRVLVILFLSISST